MSHTISETIRKNRFHEFTLDLQGALVQPGQAVGIRQVRHAFQFGVNAFWLTHPLPPEARARLEVQFLDLFNAATLPFYWGRYEPEEGQPQQAVLQDAAVWCQSHGIPTKGHPLCWHTVCADWLLKYDDATILEKQMARITQEVSAFKGLVDSWDVINEVVIMPVFDKYDNAVTRIANYLGHIELTLRCFRQARESNPGATLLINDFDLSQDYEVLLEELLARDCPIDAIGLQTHQHRGYRGADYMVDVIDRFARFGKPLHFTENTLISGELMPTHIVDLNDYQVSDWPSTPEGEARQLEEVEEMYSTIYARPEVAALIWWDMLDGGWLGAPAGLIRKDLTPKPAYIRLQELVRGDWWFPACDLVVDDTGAVRLTGPEGDYEITLAGRTVPVSLSRDTPQVTVSLRQA